MAGLMDQDWYTPAKLSAFLSDRGISLAVNTLAKWRSEGDGPAFIKLGGAVMYAHEDIERWLESRRKGGNIETKNTERAARARRSLALPIHGARPLVQRAHRLGGHKTKRERAALQLTTPRAADGPPTSAK